MKTTLNLVDILWQRINASPLKTAVTGGVYKHRRPTASQKEDVVINCLPINNEQLQQGIANVNIHVPNKAIAVNGIQDNTQPDHERLSELTELAITSLTDVWQDDYQFDIEQQQFFADEEAGDHYINLRIEFFNINI